MWQRKGDNEGAGPVGSVGFRLQDGSDAQWPRRRLVEKGVGVCGLASGGMHGLVTQSHFAEWWGYGVFFLVTTACLLAFGLALLTDAIDPRHMPGDVARIRWLMYAGGAMGNLSLIALYLVSRTLGNPVGPEAGSVEGVGVIDLIAKGGEVLAVMGLVLLLVRTFPRRRSGGMSGSGVAR